MGYCTVNGCDRTNDKRLNSVKQRVDENLDFFRFPRKFKYRKIWKKLCGDITKCNKKKIFICSRHFKPEDYDPALTEELLNPSPKSSRKLKADAIPSLNLPNTVLAKRLRLETTKAITTTLKKKKANLATEGKASISTKYNSRFHFVPSGTLPITYNGPREHSSPHWNTEPEGSDKWHEIQMKFLNHVIITLVNRCRNGDPNIIMLDNMLKTNAKEAASILCTKLYPNLWIHTFKEELKMKDALHPPQPVPCNSSKDILDIIKEEWSKFSCPPEYTDLEDKDEKKLLDANSIQIEDSIKSYGEALGCLQSIKDYVIYSDNLRPIATINKIEELLISEIH